MTVNQLCHDIIQGNKHLLSYDKDWKALIEYYEEKSCIVEADEMSFYGKLIIVLVSLYVYQ